MEMDVPGYTSAGSLSEVEAEVEAVRPVNAAQATLCSSCKFDHLVCHAGFKCGERIRVHQWHDKQMPRRIRKRIETHKALVATVNDESRLFGDRTISTRGNRKVDRRKQVAEDAIEVAWPRFEGRWNAFAAAIVGATDIVVTPRRPESVHSCRV